MLLGVGTEGGATVSCFCCEEMYNDHWLGNGVAVY